MRLTAQIDSLHREEIVIKKMPTLKGVGIDSLAAVRCT